MNEYTAGQTLRYVGPDAESPVNRTILAPYGSNPDIVSFRRWSWPGFAEVMSSRGSLTVRAEHLEAVSA